MIGLVLGMMIGLWLAIMEQGARKAHITTKGQCMDKQPKVKVGDRVRIIKGTSYGQTGKNGEVRGKDLSGYGFEFRPDGTDLRYWMSKLCLDKWEILQRTKEQAMTQQTFKIGDRVRVKTNISSDLHGRGKTGVITTNHHTIDWAYIVQFDNGGQDYFKSEHLEHLMKNLDTLTEGDVVVDKDNITDTMTVLHVLKPGLYVMSNDDEDTLLYSAKEFERQNYIPQQDPEDDKTSMTVAEVAKKLGLNPDKLHIVADKKAA